MVQAIEEALQAEGLVLTRETDLEAVNWYLKSQTPATLVAVLGQGEDRQVAPIDTTYGVTPLGEYIIRWHGDSIEDVLTNGETHLLVDDEAQDKQIMVFFNRVREVFFGDTKAFIICTPVKGNG